MQRCTFLNQFPTKQTFTENMEEIEVPITNLIMGMKRVAVDSTASCEDEYVELLDFEGKLLLRVVVNWENNVGRSDLT